VPIARVLLVDGDPQLHRRLTDGTSIAVEFALHGVPRALPPAWDENLLRIGQEVVTNVLRHAKARYLVASLAFDATGLRLELRDDGRGFDTATRGDGFGLLGMVERVEQMGGALTLRSARDAGTVIAISLPLETPA
jgi:signal transduction histidine kinase